MIEIAGGIVLAVLFLTFAPMVLAIAFYILQALVMGIFGSSEDVKPPPKMPDAPAMPPTETRLPDRTSAFFTLGSVVGNIIAYFGFRGAKEVRAGPNEEPEDLNDEDRAG